MADTDCLKRSHASPEGMPYQKAASTACRCRREAGFLLLGGPQLLQPVLARALPFHHGRLHHLMSARQSLPRSFCRIHASLLRPNASARASSRGKRTSADTASKSASRDNRGAEGSGAALGQSRCGSAEEHGVGIGLEGTKEGGAESFYCSQAKACDTVPDLRSSPALGLLRDGKPEVRA